MKKWLIWSMTLVLLMQVLAGCNQTEASQPSQKVRYKNFSFDVKPETFEVFVTKDGVKERASEPLQKRKVTDFKKTARSASWKYPDDNVEISLKKKKHALKVDIRSTGAKAFTWPKVKAKSYTLPLWEGKYIPSRDRYWKKFLKDQSYSFIESFSMRFFALNKKKYSILYVADNMFNDTVDFDVNPQISFSFTHEFPRINPKKSYGFNIYVTDKDPVSVAKIYKKHVSDRGEFKTLQEKAKQNKNIEKLYGAPHIYLWNNKFFSEEDIRWSRLRKQLDDKFVQWINQLSRRYVDDGAETEKLFKDIQKQAYVAKYQRQGVLRAFNELLRLKELYNPNVFTKLDEETKKTAKNIDRLNEVQLYSLNKKLLKSVLQDSVAPTDHWDDADSVNILKGMRNSGIRRSWIGFPDWTQGYMNPKFVKQVNKAGYLIGPYDSYHSIHKPKDEEWNTASFKDKTLYDQATITNKNGKKVKGFLGKGRKLNPTLSLPSVRYRVNEILKTGVAFNSWFIDCDATGEIYDDYSPQHITTQKQDLKARMKRMAYIRDEKNMVIGSEGGNDFASQTIAFAHGIEFPGLPWGDTDVRLNKNSPYYAGGYWSPDGGVPPVHGKPVPIKKLYQHIYLSPAYSLPLFKLVYNDSVITTYHWSWGSLKIKGEKERRMLYEMLYNVPPMYHLDQKKWKERRQVIQRHVNAWSPLHKKAVTKEMTDFKYLSKDRSVQMTRFGSDLKVIANFSKRDFKYQGQTIKAKSTVVIDGKQKRTYTPQADE
ncbi:glycoside hydrolase [Salinithrix halophila]|uniref:Glycoside hydrolase n=1 Tax=Salinithrix halophila TaxID=1485204 RepID=A0ABV8JBW6_9BACL